MSCKGGTAVSASGCAGASQQVKQGGTPEEYVEGETRTKGERVRDRTGGEGEEGQGEVAMEGDREAGDERREEEEV
jgi:hypothetical protein